MSPLLIILPLYHHILLALMYIQHIPHPLAHFSREFDSGATLVVAQTTSTNATNFPSLSQPKSHRTWYIVIGIVLVVLLLSIVGFFIAHRRVRTLLPCTVKRPKRNEKQESAPHMQRTGRTRFTDEFNIIPSLNDRKGSASSRTPTSPSIEGPSTPVNGDIGLKSVKDECSYVPIPVTPVTHICQLALVTHRIASRLLSTPLDRHTRQHFLRVPMILRWILLPPRLTTAIFSTKISPWISTAPPFAHMAFLCVGS